MSSPTSSNTDLRLVRYHDLPGDPACQKCHGVGYLHLDLPVGHPEFGKLKVCDCRASQVSQQVRQRLFALSQLNELSHLTFENFQPRGRVGVLPRQADSLERAYNHAQQFAQRLEGWLVLRGDFGSGKTHLAAAIANFAVSIGVPTLFITVPDLLDTLRFAYDNPEATFEERFDQIRTAPLLVMDDFGTQNATPWAQEKLFQIINHRYINHLPLVVTTNLDEEDFEERIRSRLQDPELVSRVHILAPDYRNPAKDFGHPDTSSWDLLHNRTFANFSLRKDEEIEAEQLRSLEKAFNAALNFAKKPRGWLIFQGHPGRGKTHLAAAIANYQMELGETVQIIDTLEFLDELRSTFSPNSQISYNRRFKQARGTPLLILCNLVTTANSPWVRDKLHQLFNHRYYAELPTVITTTESLNEIDPYLRSRMQDTRLCQIFGLNVPNYTAMPFVKRKIQPKGSSK